MKRLSALVVFILFLAAGCNAPSQTSEGTVSKQATPTIAAQSTYPAIDRESIIPSSAAKAGPDSDANPPKSLSADYSDPVPLPYPVNTAGAEDSPFIMPDGKTLYFFYTPDVNVPVEKQVLDDVTGIYVSHLNDITWSSPERVWLQDPGRLALDGAEFISGDDIWFVSAREGYTGLNWFTAKRNNEQNRWQDWQEADFPQTWQVGELHMLGDDLFFHSARPGGLGGLDIWVMHREASGTWQEPQNLSVINSDRDEGWPALSPDGSELWISRDYALWRSEKAGNTWSEPEKIISPLAGEASIDQDGNIYFVHHYFENDAMVEADIYVAYRK